MRPILFILPQLSRAVLWPLLAATTIVALFFAWRASQLAAATSSRQSSTGNASGGTSDTLLAPLGMGVLVAGFLWIWSRNAITLHSYGLMLVIGFGVATWLSCREAARRKIDPNIVLDLALPLLFVSVLFCRILYILLNRSQFHSLGAMVRIWDGGLSFHGSLVAAPLVIWFYARKNRLGFGQLTDCIAPSAFMGYAIGRIGCLLNGCCYGGVCNLPWAMQFPDEHNRALLTPPSHPAQLYSSLMALGLFFLMQRVKDKPNWNRFSGQLTLLFFALYAIERFVMEIFRNGATANPIFGLPWLTQAQFASLLGLIVVAVLWIVLSRRPNSNHQPLITNH